MRRCSIARLVPCLSVSKGNIYSRPGCVCGCVCIYEYGYLLQSSCCALPPSGSLTLLYAEQWTDGYSKDPASTVKRAECARYNLSPDLLPTVCFICLYHQSHFSPRPRGPRLISCFLSPLQGKGKITAVYNEVQSNIYSSFFCSSLLICSAYPSTRADSLTLSLSSMGAIS